jgi:hypothetical protein
MRLIVSLLRVAVLSALVVVLWAKPAVTNAQAGGACQEFFLIEIVCGSCCTMHNTLDTINTSTGPGVYSIATANLVCGANPVNCKASCGTQNFPVQTYDSTCTSCKP